MKDIRKKRKAQVWLVAVAMVMTLIPAAVFAYDYSGNMPSTTSLIEDSQVPSGATLTLQAQSYASTKLQLKEYNLINRGTISNTTSGPNRGWIDMRIGQDILDTDPGVSNNLYNHGIINCSNIRDMDNGYIYNFKDCTITSEIFQFGNMTIYNYGNITKGIFPGFEQNKSNPTVIHNYGTISGDIECMRAVNGLKITIYNHPDGKILSPEIIYDDLDVGGDAEMTIYNYEGATITTDPTKISEDIKVYDESNGGTCPTIPDVSIKPIRDQIVQPSGATGIGKRVKPDVEVIEVIDADTENELTEGTDYTVSYENNTDTYTNSGRNAIAHVNFTGDYEQVGTKEMPFKIVDEIEPKDISDYDIDIPDETLYAGNTKLKVTIKDEITGGEILLEEGEDYSLEYSNNKKVGEATVTITGEAPYYTGRVSKTFTIIPRDLEDAIFYGLPDKTYTGEAIMPIPIATMGSRILHEDEDYILGYSNNTNVGRAAVTLKGKDNYTGEVSLTFNIKPKNIIRATVSNISNKTYTGKAIKPMPTVMSDDRKLINNTDYKLTYKNNIKTGKATVIITGRGNYTGTASKTFKIIPGKAAISKLTKGTKKMTVYIKSQKTQSVSGYQIGYKIKGGKYKYATTTGTSKTIKKLKSKKYYYAKVRAYKTIDDKKYYGAWSSAKRIKVK